MRLFCLKDFSFNHKPFSVAISPAIFIPIDILSLKTPYKNQPEFTVDGFNMLDNKTQPYSLPLRNMKISFITDISLQYIFLLGWYVKSKPSGTDVKYKDILNGSWDISYNQSNIVGVNYTYVFYIDMPILLKVFPF